MLHASLALLLVGIVRQVRHSTAPNGPRVATASTITWNNVAPEYSVLASPPARSEPQVPTPAPEPIVETLTTGQRPVKASTLRVLPAEILSRIRRGAEVNESSIQPAAAVMPAPPALLGGGKPMHGTLAPGQTIVYVLDASGSMGQAGKFERAKRALLATLRTQPEALRFQVIVYAGFAKRLLPEAPAVPASPANVERAAQALFALEPLGRSSHAEALKLAARTNPEFVLVLTDADDLPADAIRELTQRLARAPVLTLVLVKNTSVEPPRLVQP